MEYFVVLLAAFFHAVWNGIIKGSSDSLLTLASIRAIGLIFGILVVLFLPPLEMEAIPYMAVASLIHFLYFWFLLNTYRFGDFSQVYPISRGSAPLIVMILGTAAAGEHLSLMQCVATLIISSGILSLSISVGTFAWLPVGYALSTAACIAGYTITSGIGVRASSSFLVYAGWLEATTGIAVVFFTVAKRRRQTLKYIHTHWKQGIAAGLLSISAFSAFLWAIQSAPLAPIAALRETSIIFAALIGVSKFNEGYAKLRISASIGVATGIAVLLYFS